LNQIEKQSAVDRDVELRHLSEADVRIAEAEGVVSKQIKMVEKLRCDGQDTSVAEETLKAFQETLQTMRDHRHEIVKTIEQIDQGLI
jgi:hypothetical protein